MELKLFCIDDFEQHWVAHESADAAVDYAVKHYCMEPENVQSVKEVGMDEPFRIFLVDGYDGYEVYPSKPYRNDEGQWLVEATVREWLENAKPGDMIATTVY